MGRVRHDPPVRRVVQAPVLAAARLRLGGAAPRPRAPRDPRLGGAGRRGGRVDGAARRVFGLRRAGRRENTRRGQQDRRENPSPRVHAAAFAARVSRDPSPRSPADREERPAVPGSVTRVPTGYYSDRLAHGPPADVAQLVERDLPKVDVASSSLVIRSIPRCREGEACRNPGLVRHPLHSASAFLSASAGRASRHETPSLSHRAPARPSHPAANVDVASSKPRHPLHRRDSAPARLPQPTRPLVEEGRKSRHETPQLVRPRSHRVS